MLLLPPPSLLIIIIIIIIGCLCTTPFMVFSATYTICERTYTSYVEEVSKLSSPLITHSFGQVGCIIGYFAIEFSICAKNKEGILITNVIDNICR
jgi:hypothetical protein